MTDDRGDMSFSDPQIEFFNFDALSDDEVQRIKNVLKQPCSAVELPDFSICSSYKDQVNGVQAEYKSAPLAINMDYSHQVASTYATMPQPHMYSVASTVNGLTYIAGYAVPGTGQYVASPTPRKDYIIPKMMNGIEEMENNGGANLGEAVVDPNGVTGMVMSSNLYPSWTNVYPCPTYVLPTFFAPIAPVHAAGMRSATSTVTMCAENVIPTTVTPTLPPPAAYVAVAPVTIQPSVVAEASVLQQSQLPPEISSSLDDQGEAPFTETEVYYEKPVEGFTSEVNELSFDKEESKLNAQTDVSTFELNNDNNKPDDSQDSCELTDTKDTLTAKCTKSSSKTWASLFKSSGVRNAKSPAAPTTQPPFSAPAFVSTAEASIESTVVHTDVDKNDYILAKPKTLEIAVMNSQPSNNYCYTNGIAKETKSNDHKLGELLLNMKIDQRPVNFLPRGLYNKGNWCYINAILQALLACPPFYNFLSKLPIVPGLQNEKSNCPITDSMVEFVHEFSSTTYTGGITTVTRKKEEQLSVTIGHPFEPVYVYNVMSKVKSDAFEGRQEDAEEFLSCLLNGLHDEMLAALSSVENGIKENNGKVVEHCEDDDESWKVIEKGNKCSVTRSATFSSSPVSDIFCGRIRSALHAVSTSSATLQPFFSLQLDIQSESVRTVKEALLGLVTKENLQGYHCSKTKQEVAASRQITLEELPPILILHLKRFVYDKDGGCQKLSKKLDFKIDLEFGKELLSNTAKSKLGNNKLKLYKLIAVVYHCGREAIKGHYIADVYHHGSSTWLRADDTKLTLVQETEVLNHPTNLVPYMLFYRRLDDGPSNIVGSAK